MDSSNASLLAQHADAHGSGETDFTPQPLRISKQRHQRNLSASSDCLPMTKVEQGSFLPSRQTSMQKGRAHGDLSRHRASLSLGSTVEESLNIRKQRRSDPVRACSDNNSDAFGTLPGVTLSYPPAQSRPRRKRDFSPSMRDLNSRFVDSGPTCQARSALRRSLTIPITRPAGPSNYSQNKPSIPLPPIPSILEGRRRAVTSAETYHSLSELRDLENSLDRDTGRRPSVRQRFVSRMMNSLGSRTKVGYGVAQHDEHLPDMDKAVPNLLESSNNPHHTRSRPDTMSTMETESVLGGDFDTVLAAFPTPPSSSLTSPTTLTSSETSRADWMSTLRRPRDVPVVGAELSMTPELLKLSSDTGQSMYASVEVKGVVNSPATTCETALDYQRLDVAVVIDNSLFASPATLMASCETARFVASSLDPTTDRLAILSTMPVDVNAPPPEVISPLSEATIRDAKSKVDTIVGSTEKPDVEALPTAIAIAKNILTQSRPSKTERGPAASTHGHIFVLSSRLNGLCPRILRDGSVQIHLLCPGSIPWQPSGKIASNGWKLRSHYTDELQFMTYNKKDMDATSLFNCIRGLISRARRGVCSGTIYNLVLDINAGPECSIEGVMGRREIPSLQPGEVVTSLVKLKVGAPPAKGYSLAPSQNSPQSRPGPQDLTDEIDGLLGTSAITILTAKLRYNHSLLPAGTTCTITAESRLKREDPSSTRSRLRHTSSKVQPSGVTKSQITVQKRLVFYLATHHSPRHAMFTLRQEFGDAGSRSVCSDYIKLVTEELKYQARIIDRFDIGLGGEAPESPFEHFGQGLFDITNYRPQDWLTNVPDEESSSKERERRNRRQASVKQKAGKQSLEHTVLRQGQNEARKALAAAPTAKMCGGRHYVSPKVDLGKNRWSKEERKGNQRSLSGKKGMAGVFAVRM